MDHPRPGLRYVDAGDLTSSTIRFDRLPVESNTGDKLGDVDGFIIDVRSARPYYVVVDGGGWFSSKFFLLPVGHVGLASGSEKLVADLPRERVKRFPGFDRDEFERLSEDELDRMDAQMVAACCPDETIDRANSASRYEQWNHYRNPTWWDSSYYAPERADAAARSMASTGTAMPSRSDVRADRDAQRERERVTASAGDVSPHFGGRAQPGDVLGVETGGERTHIGETTDDENKRREDAEKNAREQKRR